MAQMPSPSSRIFAGPIATYFCPIENNLDPPAQAAGRFSLSTPDGLDHLNDVIGVNVLDGSRPKHRRNISRDCVSPLLAMFSFFQLACCTLISESAHWSKVIERAASNFSEAACSISLRFRWVRGSCPSLKRRRASFAFLRASARLTLCKPPNPISRARPRSVKRKVQLFERLRPIRKYRPPPSA